MVDLWLLMPLGRTARSIIVASAISASSAISCAEIHRERRRRWWEMVGERIEARWQQLREQLKEQARGMRGQGRGWEVVATYLLDVHRRPKWHDRQPA